MASSRSRSPGMSDMKTTRTAEKSQTRRKASKSESLQGDARKGSTPSIYAIVAAYALSRDIKQKSQRLMKVKRKHGDWGEFDLTHAWSLEDYACEFGSRLSSALERNSSSSADESLAMARPFVMQPLRLFQEHRVEPIIRHVLESTITDQKYDPTFCKYATIKISDEIKERVKRLEYPRYKFVCHVVIGERNQQDVKMVSRCAWDTAVDRFAQYQFQNAHLYAVGVVYGVYCE